MLLIEICKFLCITVPKWSLRENLRNNHSAIILSCLIVRTLSCNRTIEDPLTSECATMVFK